MKSEGDNKKWRRPKMRGLGDVVHTVAQPIAKTIDAIVKTNIAGCSGCQKRREMLNLIVSFEYSNTKA